MATMLNYKTEISQNNVLSLKLYEVEDFLKMGLQHQMRR